jgi:hypothetical protein
VHSLNISEKFNTETDKTTTINILFSHINLSRDNYEEKDDNKYIPTRPKLQKLQYSIFRCPIVLPPLK